MMLPRTRLGRERYLVQAVVTAEADAIVLRQAKQPVGDRLILTGNYEKDIVQVQSIKRLSYEFSRHKLGSLFRGVVASEVICGIADNVCAATSAYSLGYDETIAATKDASDFAGSFWAELSSFGGTPSKVVSNELTGHLQKKHYGNLQMVHAWAIVNLAQMRSFPPEMWALNGRNYSSSVD